MIAGEVILGVRHSNLLRTSRREREKYAYNQFYGCPAFFGTI